MAVAQGAGQRVEIDHGAAAVVDQERARLHRAQLLLADHAGGLRRLGHMQADDVALRQQLLQLLDRLGIAMAELVGAVVKDHAHANGFGERRELRADIAVADDAERLAADLVAAGRRLVPAAVMGRTERGKICRSSITISPMTSSATLRVLENGALKTGMPRLRAASRSTWLVPTQKQPTAISPSAAASTSSVIWVRERMPSSGRP